MLRASMVHEYERTQCFTRVARNLNVNVKTVRLWVQRHKETQDVKSKKSSGRTRALDDQACEVAEGLLLDDTFGSLGSVAKEMSMNHGVNASTYTISRSVKDFCKRNNRAIEANNSKPKKQLTPATMKKRLDFCKANKRTCWGHVMFTDRCKFHHTYVGGVVKKSVWRRVGESRFAPRVNHASTLNVYAGITKHGVTHMHVVAGTTSHKSQFTNKKGETAKNIS